MRRVERLLLVLLAGCSPTSDAWRQRVEELASQGNAVIDAVAGLPECAGAMRNGGVIHWRAVVYCRGTAVPVLGCSYPYEHPPLVEVAFESAWGNANPARSTLAHELCHICGYTDEEETEACARRAKANYEASAWQAPVVQSGP